MRISTNMMYERGVGAMQQQSASLLQTFQQISSGRRVLTPADDPIASARAVELNQQRSINTQYGTNQGYANDNLSLLESKLGGVGDILHYVRERVVQAGNGALSEEDLGHIAADLEAQFEGLLGLANTQDLNGDFLFAGYKSQTRPFAGGLGGVDYVGDQGTRTMQVSASRFMPVSLPGSEVFEYRGPIDAGAISLVKNAGNSGNKVLEVAAADTAALRPATHYQISYASDGSYTVARTNLDGSPAAWSDAELERMWPATPPATGFEVPAGYALSGDRTSISYDASAASGPHTITFDGLAVSVPAAGTASSGDRFDISVPSKNIFDSIGTFIDALRKPGSDMASAVSAALGALDTGLDNVLRVRAQVGSQLVEVEQLQNLGADLDLQYATTLSGLQDVDYAEAISRLTQQQTYLQAAQQSFMRVTGLSLFNYLT